MVIDERNTIRTSANRPLELALEEETANAIQHDQLHWMDRAIQDGHWPSIRKAYKAKPPPQGQLHDRQGIC